MSTTITPALRRIPQCPSGTSQRAPCKRGRCQDRIDTRSIFTSTPFQLGSVTDTSGLANPYFFMGDWHDVMYVPSGYSIPQVHFHTADFTGKVVAHCHFLNHEDQGCMGFWEITGDNGTVVSDLASRAMTTVVSPPPSTSSSGTVHVASVARAFALCALATLFAYA